MKRRPDSLRDQYPIIFAFGDGAIPPLDPDAAIVATPQERIRSIWPFLVRTVLKFVGTLRHRDRANYDPEDVLMELYVALMEKDAKWEPARGRYITFAARVAVNELHAIRDRTHTVHSPRNSSCRLKQYEAAAVAGQLSRRKAKTYSDIRRVVGEHEGLDADTALPVVAPDTADVVDRRDHLRLVNSAVIAGVMVLAPVEAATLGGAYGLWGRTEEPLALLAFHERMSLDELKKTKGRAQEKIRARLLAIRHPLAKAQ